MFEKETFPDSRWGTYGSHSVFVERTFNSRNYDDLDDMYETVTLDIARFKADNPNGTISVYNIKDDDDCENILYEAENKVDEIIQERKREEERLAREAFEREQERHKQEDLRKLEELKAKYEKY